MSSGSWSRRIDPAFSTPLGLDDAIPLVEWNSLNADFQFLLLDFKAIEATPQTLSRFGIPCLA